MKTIFKIDNEVLSANIDLNIDSISVNSSPRPYEVLFKDNVFSFIEKGMDHKEFSYVFFIDENIASLYEEETKFMKNYPYKSFNLKGCANVIYSNLSIRFRCKPINAMADAKSIALFVAGLILTPNADSKYRPRYLCKKYQEMDKITA